MTQTFLRQKGGYRRLRVYRVATVIYDITFFFAEHFLQKSDRTIDQMVQAARSGKQNIAEGSEAATTSAETEIKLTNVAKASLEELLIDYEDYLRVRNKELWDAGHPRYEAMKHYASSERLFVDYQHLLPRMSDEEMANLAVTLIHQTTYMLRRLIAHQQEEFLRNGGIREQMTRARLQARQQRGEGS